MTHKDILPPVKKVKKVIPGMITLPSTNKKEIYGLNKLLKDEVCSLIEPLAKLIRKDKLTLSPLSNKAMKGLYSDMSTPAAMHSLLKDQLISIYSSFATELCNIFAVASVESKM